VGAWALVRASERTRESGSEHYVRLDCAG